MTAAVIQVFIQPQTEVSTKKKKKEAHDVYAKWYQERLQKAQLLWQATSEDSGRRHVQRIVCPGVGGGGGGEGVWLLPEGKKL